MKAAGDTVRVESIRRGRRTGEFVMRLRTNDHLHRCSWFVDPKDSLLTFDERGDRLFTRSVYPRLLGRLIYRVSRGEKLDFPLDVSARGSGRQVKHRSARAVSQV